MHYDSLHSGPISIPIPTTQSQGNQTRRLLYMHNVVIIIHLQVMYQMCIFGHVFQRSARLGGGSNHVEASM